MDIKLESFFSAVREVFGYLIHLGFMIPESGIEETPLYGRISFYGENVCIVFSYDLRDGKPECYVGKIHSGKIITNRNEGGYWSSLYSYLLHKKAFRGKLPMKTEWMGKDFPELLAFQVLLNEKAEDILGDSEDAFSLPVKDKYLGTK